MPRITKVPTNPEYKILLDNYKSAGKSTLDAYRNNYYKMFSALDGLEIHTVSEKMIIDAVNELDIKNVNTKSALLNIAVVVRKMPDYQLGTAKIVAEREKLRDAIVSHTKDKNDEINLPSYEDIVNHMNQQYEDENYRGYIINYLLIHFQTRNQDLNFKIVRTKKEMNDESQNYLWLNVRTNTVLYWRNIYKTNKSYSTLKHEITDKKFIKSLKAITKLQNAGHKDGVFIKNISSLATYVISYTLDKIGEGKYVKIVINHFKDDLQTLKQISKNRGTSIETLLAFYDIEKNNKPKTKNL